MSLDLEAIKARAEAATLGPWYWGGHDDHPGGIDLRSRARMTPIVMAFRRWGLQGAEPVFWHRPPGGDGWTPAKFVRARDVAVREVSYRSDVVSLNVPDAEFIAHARQDVNDLLAEVERLRAENEVLVDAYDTLKSDADATVGRLTDKLYRVDL